MTMTMTMSMSIDVDVDGNGDGDSRGRGEGNSPGGLDSFSAELSEILGLTMWCARIFFTIFQVDPGKTPGDRARAVGSFQVKIWENSN